MTLYWVYTRAYCVQKGVLYHLHHAQVTRVLLGKNRIVCEENPKGGGGGVLGSLVKNRGRAAGGADFAFVNVRARAGAEMSNTAKSCRSSKA